MNIVVNFLKKNYYLLTSFLLFLSFPTYDIVILKFFPLFAWFAFIPLFVFIRGKSLKDIFFYSAITGLVGYFLTNNWIGEFGAAVPGGDIIILFFLIPLFTMYLSFRIILAELLSRKFEKLRILLFPTVWIFFDWIQSIGYIAYPGTYIGYSQFPFTSFIQISSYTGIMGINFIMIFFQYAMSDLYLYYKNNSLSKTNTSSRFPDIFYSSEFKKAAGIVIFIIIITVHGFAVKFDKKPEKSDLKVAFVQSCISPWENWALNKYVYLNELKHYTTKALVHDPDFIIWSESATLESIAYNYAKNSLIDFEINLLDFVKTMGKPLLTGEIGIKEKVDGYFLKRYPQNNGVLIDGEGRVVQTYPKINLVPFGEWFPYENSFPWVKKIASAMGGSDFVPGEYPMLFELFNRRFSVLVCFEGIFYRLCREYKKLGVDYFINITNDGWTDTYSGHMQHFSSSVFRAIENGVWYLRAGNTGFTTIIDPYGRIVKSIPILTKNYMIGDIDFNLNHETFYEKFGDWFLYLNFIFLAVVLVLFLIPNLVHFARSRFSGE
jgi:apolipoprotein N-acyltransferase